jgi:hypothetical protein
VPRQAERPAELLVWTDVDPAHEADFNKWYDREHMDERVAIPGFAFARRFLRIGPGRKYLALYRTDSLGVFDSAPYRRAFENQTQWSRDNFSRMRESRRCVGTVVASASTGTGGIAGLIVFTADRAPEAQAELERAASRDGVVSGYILEPDRRLSTPLPGATAGTLDGSILVLEGTTEPAVAEAVERMQRALGASEHALFRLMWRLDRALVESVQR